MDSNVDLVSDLPHSLTQIRTKESQHKVQVLNMTRNTSCACTSSGLQEFGIVLLFEVVPTNSHKHGLEVGLDSASASNGSPRIWVDDEVNLYNVGTVKKRNEILVEFGSIGRPFRKHDDSWWSAAVVGNRNLNMRISGLALLCRFRSLDVPSIRLHLIGQFFRKNNREIPVAFSVELTLLALEVPVDDDCVLDCERSQICCHELLLGLYGGCRKWPD